MHFTRRSGTNKPSDKPSHKRPPPTTHQGCQSAIEQQPSSRAVPSAVLEQPPYHFVTLLICGPMLPPVGEPRLRHRRRGSAAALAAAPATGSLSAAPRGSRR